jgi:hypothetical protein
MSLNDSWFTSAEKYERLSRETKQRFHHALEGNRKDSIEGAEKTKPKGKYVQLEAVNLEKTAKNLSWKE